MSTDISAGSEYIVSLTRHLQFLYSEFDCDSLARKIVSQFDDFRPPTAPGTSAAWSENDSVLITYGDSLHQSGNVPLQSLAEFLDDYGKDSFSIVHVLPFSPFSSDDGFAVIDYTEVNPELGSWDDLKRLASSRRLMADLVINHVSSESRWFENYRRAQIPVPTTSSKHTNRMICRKWFVRGQPDSCAPQKLRTAFVMSGARSVMIRSI